MALAKKLSMALVGSAVLALGTSGAAQAASFLSTSDGKVGTVDTATGSFTQVLSGPQFTDIALSEANDFFGITFGQLFKVDVGGGSTSLIGNLGATLNALGFGGDGNLYGAGGSGFYKINTTTGAATLVSTISGFGSSGDIVFDPLNNRFLATSLWAGSDKLFSIALDGTATQIGNLGFSNVYGLFFENGTLFGYTANRQQIKIDLGTGAGILDKNLTGLSGQIYGAASLPSTGPSTSVPEPGTLLGLFGIAALGGVSQLKRQRKSGSSVTE